MDKLEKTRIGLGGFEEFKKQRNEEIGQKPVSPNAGDDVQAKSTDIAADDQGNAIVAVPLETDPALDKQSELGLDEPPVVMEVVAEPEDWAHSITEPTLLSWWNEFIETQSVRTASLMKTVRPFIEGKEVVVKIAASKMEVLEAVKFPFNRFIAEHSQGKLTNLRIEAGEVVDQERKPYTDKEKLDYMIRKNPKLDEVIKKLGLRLP